MRTHRVLDREAALIRDLLTLAPDPVDGRQPRREIAEAWPWRSSAATIRGGALLLFRHALEPALDRRDDAAALHQRHRAVAPDRRAVVDHRDRRQRGDRR